jgi:hypothetical protein
MAFANRVLAGLLACACVAVTAADPVYSVDAHVVGAGASARADSACFRLRATIAEPVAGFASSADYVIAGGFRATPRGAGDDIFFSGFEDCAP